MRKKVATDPKKHGGGNAKVNRMVRCRDVVKEKIRAMHANEVAEPISGVLAVNPTS